MISHLHKMKGRTISFGMTVRRGATGAARAPGLGKTNITRRRAAAAAATLFFQNQGKTWVLPVLPGMAPLFLLDKALPLRVCAP